MALTEVTNPRKTLGTTPPYDADSASTTQLRYVFNESDLTNIEKYVLEIEIPELNNLLVYYVPDPSTGNIEFDLGFILLRGMGDSQYLDYHVVATPYRDRVAESGLTSINILAIASEIQILYSQGANLNEFIAKATTPANVAYFQTFLNEPKIWDGWTTANHVINQDIIGTVDVKIVDLDINKNPISTITPADIWTTRRIEEYPLTYSAGAEYRSYQYSQTAVPLTVEKIYKQEPECRNPIMIYWWNELGGIDYWLFTIEQAVNNIADEGLQWDTPITEDISQVRQTKERYSGRNIQFITVKTAFLNKNEISVLHYLKKSPKVSVALSKDLSEYIEVRVANAFETNYTTGKGNYEFSCTIEFPDGFDFFKGVHYQSDFEVMMT